MEMNDNKNKRPKVISLFGFFLLLGGIGSLVIGLSRILDLQLTGFMYLLHGICILIIFIGLMGGEKWALKLLIFLFLFTFFLGLWEPVEKTTNIFFINLIGISIVLFITIYLFTRKNVKKYFSGN